MAPYIKGKVGVNNDLVGDTDFTSGALGSGPIDVG
jgi:hypothetical protein